MRRGMSCRAGERTHSTLGEVAHDERRVVGRETIDGRGGREPEAELEGHAVHKRCGSHCVRHKTRLHDVVRHDFGAAFIRSGETAMRARGAHGSNAAARVSSGRRGM